MFNGLFSNRVICRFSTGMLVGCLISTLFTGCACSDPRQPKVDKNKDNPDKEIALAASKKPRITASAIAYVKSFQGNQATGRVIFKKVADGVRIIADFDGLTPGAHGFHIHEHGDCSGTDGAATGAHFNPTDQQHGSPDSPVRHVGDLGNLVADEYGHAHYERVDHLIALEGKNSIIGRSIVVHADADDYTSQPAGASGAKIACGVIEAANLGR